MGVIHEQMLGPEMAIQHKRQQKIGEVRSNFRNFCINSWAWTMPTVPTVPGVTPIPTMIPKVSGVE